MLDGLKALNARQVLPELDVGSGAVSRQHYGKMRTYQSNVSKRTPSLRGSAKANAERDICCLPHKIVHAQTPTAREA